MTRKMNHRRSRSVRSRSRTGQHERNRRRLLGFEPLEARRLLASFVVNSTGDEPDSGAVPATCDTALDPLATPPIPASGVCTLRAAIDSANQTSGPDTITFSIPAGSEIVTDGYVTAGGVTINGPSGRIRITAPGLGTAGLLLGGSGGSTVRNLVINGFNEAIRVFSPNNTVAGNYVGVNEDGTAAIGNILGIVVEGNNNVIGGTDPADRNLISGNEVGILVVDRLAGLPDTVAGNRIEGNFVGTDVTGTLAIGNSEVGVRISQSAVNNIVGGAGAAGNLISGNRHGLIIENQTARGNLVAGNLIGTDVTGTLPLGNVEAILINRAPDNLIGGALPGTQEIIGNVISGSLGDFANSVFGMGILIGGATATGNVVQGNRIGTDITGIVEIPNAGDGVHISEASGNTIGGTTAARRNVISGNNGDGVTIASSTAVAASNNHVIGNYIGVDAGGTAALGNGFRGVHIDSNATSNVVGGDSASSRNIISANGADGVIIALAGAENNVIKGNYIGTDKDGTAGLGNAGAGVFIFEAARNIIGQTGGTSFSRNVIADNQDGVKIEGVDAIENVVEGNLIGTRANGTEALGNHAAGVYLLGAPENRIGSQNTLAPLHPNFSGNVISGNTLGVKIEGAEAQNNQVEGNLIGTSHTGLEPLGNDDEGVWLLNTRNNRIGSQLSADPDRPTLVGNTIADNRRGILIQGAASHGNQISGNRIGTNVQGQLVGQQINIFGNLLQGIRIVDAQENYIGGDPQFFIGDLPANGTSLPGNVIAGNGLEGIEILGNTATQNQIRRTAIHSNGLLGIDLGPDGVTENDDLDGDGDQGGAPNLLQNFPLPDGIVATNQLAGTINSKPNTTFIIDVFGSDEEDPSGHGEGQQFLGETTVTTNQDGDGTWAVQLDANAFIPPVLTATATDPDGNTSEFSPPLKLADLHIDDFTLFATQVERRGREFVLPYSITVRNVGLAAAENARFEIFGNGLQIDFHIVDLQPREAKSLIGEWDITHLIIGGIRGATGLEFKVIADPNNTIPELLTGVNVRTKSVGVDARPRIELLESEFKPNGFYLAGVDLPNIIDLTIDWNGDLSQGELGHDEQPELLVEFNGAELFPIAVSDPFAEKFTYEINLGSFLELGPNTLTFRAETALHQFLSDARSVSYDQGNAVESLGIIWEVFEQPGLGGGQYNKSVEYKTAFFFPELAAQNPDSPQTSGFYNIPVSRVGFAGGALGGIVPQGNLAVSIRSDRTGEATGFLKFDAKTAGKEPWADGSTFVAFKGTFDFVPGDVNLKKAELFLRAQGQVLTAKVPLPPVLQWLRLQGKVGAGVDATFGVEETSENKWDFTNALLGLNGFAEVVLSTGIDKVVSLEVAGGGAAKLQLQLPPVPCLTHSADVLIFGRVKALFFSLFEASHVFRHSLIDGGCGGPAPSGEGSLALGPVLTDVRLLPRFTVLTEGETSSEGLPSIAFPYAMPTLARRDDGTMMLVWVDEDPAKADGQHLEIFASQYDGNSWSPPVQVTDDTLIDNQPTLAYDSNGRAVAMWTRLKNTLTDPTNTDPASLLDEMEIVYAVRDAATGQWSAPLPLTDNAEMDYLPRLSADAAGNLAAMWLRDSDNDMPIFPDDSTPLGADLLFSTWDGTSWSAPLVAVPDAAIDSRPQLAHSGGQGLVVWSDDADRDITTNSDREIRVATWDGNAWSAPAVLGGGDTLPDVAPQVAYDSTGRANIVWVKASVSNGSQDSDVGDQFYFAELDGGNFSAPAPVVEAVSITDPRLLIDDDDNAIVVWQAISESGPDIFYATLDRSTGQWSEPIQFSDDANLEWWFNPFINDAGELEIIYLEREVGTEPAPEGAGAESEGEEEDGETIPAFTSSHLATAAQPLGHDLQLVELALSAANPVPGSVVQVTATVRNGGTWTTPAVALELTDDGAAVGAAQTVPQLAAGQAASVTFDWTVPQSAAAPHTLVAAVDPLDEVAELDEANNEATLVSLKPDLTVETFNTDFAGDTITVEAVIVNRGGSPTATPLDVALRIDDPENGQQLGTFAVADPLAPGQSATARFTIDNALAALGGARTAYAVADASEQIDELDEENNRALGGLDPQQVSLLDLPLGTGSFRVGRDGSEVTVTDQGGSELLREQIAAVRRVHLVATPDEDNQLTVDTSGGLFSLPDGVHFLGGAGGNDALRLVGGSAESVAHTFTGAGSGHVAITGNGESLAVVYGGLEPIEDLFDAPDRSFQFGDGDDVIRLEDGAPADEMYRLSSEGSSETVDFRMTQGRVTLQTGGGGNQVDAGDFTQPLTVIGGVDSDWLRVADLALADFNGGEGSDTLELSGAGVALDLTALPAGRLRGVDRIDLRAAGSNSLTLDAAAVEAISDAGALSVVAGADDALLLGDGWLFSGVEVRDQLFFRNFAQNGVQLQASGPRAWQNPISKHDVNGDNQVVPFDILFIINLLNDPLLLDDAGRFVAAASVDPADFRFYDVDGNGFGTSFDALNIINFFAGSSAAEGESRSTAPPANTGLADSFWAAMAADLATPAARPSMRTSDAQTSQVEQLWPQQPMPMHRGTTSTPQAAQRSIHAAAVDQLFEQEWDLFDDDLLAAGQ